MTAMPAAGTWLVSMPWQRVILLMALLLSAIVVAQDGARLEISSDSAELLSDEIYRQAEGWRQPPMFESEWRAPRKEEPSRIRFGFDSAYEAAQARQSASSPASQRDVDLHEPRPNTILRWNF
jgi:hypothetical protein